MTERKSMHTPNIKNLAGAVTLLFSTILPAYAQSIIISEVDPSGSANTAYAADWFELTNTGSSAVNITGWKMDDNSNLFANAVALRGVTSIAAGQSVIFIEGTATGTTDSTIDTNFIATWFGSNIPAGLTIGNYGGPGVGLSQAADAVNIFDASGNLITRVDFGVAAPGTFDNAVGSNNVTLTQKSVVGVNGAFASLAGGEIGSPGVVANPVPEPESYAMMLAGLGLLGFVGRRRKQKSSRAL
jgi:hypothetical protein